MKQLPRVNRGIKSQVVKVINEQGKVLGELDIREAMRIARETGYDLVEVAPNAQPPVCKLLDYGKYLYEKKRQERDARKHQHRMNARGMRFSLRISEHDYQVKLNKIKEFLEDGDRVKIALRLRGRELVHVDLGIKVINRVITDVQGLGKVEKPTAREMNTLYVTLIPDKK